MVSRSVSKNFTSCPARSGKAAEIIRIYALRWDIEVFFKCAKSLLRLQKEFQGRSFDLLISLQ
jgi:hypothetical protein